MLGGRQQPGAQPLGEWCEHPSRCCGVRLEQRPLCLGQLLTFVQDRTRNLELADVVKEHAPRQLQPVVLGEIEFGRDEIGVGPNPFGVASGQSVVPSETVDQTKRIDRRFVGGPRPKAFGCA